MTDVRFVEQSNSPMVQVKFRYDASLIALLKDVTSSSIRNYDPASKTWSVHEDIAQQLGDEMLAAGHRIFYGDSPVPAAVPEANLDQFFAAPVDERALVKAKVDEILENVPAQHLHKVFREFAKRLYPDLYAR